MEIDHVPTKKWIVYDVVKCTFDRLMDEIAMRANTNQHPPVLNWCNGVLFFFGWFPYNDFIVSQAVEGIKHLNYAFVAPMEEYSKEINIKSGGHIVVMDRTNDNEIAILCEYFKGMFDIK